MAGKRPGGKSGGPGDRKPTDDEHALWQHVMRDTRPLSRGAKKAALVRGRDRPVGQVRRGGGATTRPDPSTPPPGTGLDKRSAQRLKRGRLAIDGRIDLHGMTLDQAHAALDAFLDRADRAGKRCILVITGKGRRARAMDRDTDRDFGAAPRGVLRDAVPRWLQVGANRHRVLAIETARPQHGGDGAFYVLMRRKRT